MTEINATLVLIAFLFSETILTFKVLIKLYFNSLMGITEHHNIYTTDRAPESEETFLQKRETFWSEMWYI